MAVSLSNTQLLVVNCPIVTKQCTLPLSVLSTYFIVTDWLVLCPKMWVTVCSAGIHDSRCLQRYLHVKWTDISQSTVENTIFIFLDHGIISIFGLLVVRLVYFNREPCNSCSSHSNYVALRFIVSGVFNIRLKRQTVYPGTSGYIATATVNGSLKFLQLCEQTDQPELLIGLRWLFHQMVIVHTKCQLSSAHH